jgi:hypothetical protein
VQCNTTWRPCKYFHFRSDGDNTSLELGMWDVYVHTVYKMLETLRLYPAYLTVQNLYLHNQFVVKNRITVMITIHLCRA